MKSTVRILKTILAIIIAITGGIIIWLLEPIQDWIIKNVKRFREFIRRKYIEMYIRSCGTNRSIITMWLELLTHGTRLVTARPPHDVYTILNLNTK